MEVEIGGPVAQELPALRNVTGVTAATHRPVQNRDISSVQARHGHDLQDSIFRATTSGGWSLLTMQSVGASLEETFLRLTTGVGAWGGFRTVRVSMEVLYPPSGWG